MLSWHRRSTRSASLSPVSIKAALTATALFVSACSQVHNDPACNSAPYTCRRAVSIFLPWEGEVRLQAAAVTFKGQRSAVKRRQITLTHKVVPPVGLCCCS